MTREELVERLDRAIKVLFGLISKGKKPFPYPEASLVEVCARMGVDEYLKAVTAAEPGGGVPAVTQDPDEGK